MIHYDLRCGSGHSFDGWFRSSTAFDDQAGAGLLDCPVCASPEVSRALMAPLVGRSVSSVAPSPKPAPRPVVPQPPEAEPVQAMSAVTPPPMPDQLRAVLQRMRAEVEQKCDYVGPRFAEAARAIHSGEAPARPIYGETTPDQAEALAEDGIEVARIPWLPRADS